MSQTAEGTYSNTVLYPVTEEARAMGGTAQNGNSDQSESLNRSNNKNTNKAIPKRQPGAPSRYLEYEGPDATYSIRIGTHPAISYPDLKDFPDTEIRIRYDFGSDNANANSASRKNKSNRNNNIKGTIFQADDCPRHFLWLSDRAVKKEVNHKLQMGEWSERVLVEKTYFTLFYGGTGLASQYMDSVDDFETDLVGWEIMNRSSNHCEWEGVECSNNLNKGSKNSNKNSKKQQQQQHVVGFQINGFSLEGTLPHDLYQLSFLKRLDLRGNRIKGSIPASWGNLYKLANLDLGDNRLTGELPSSLENWTNLKSVLLSANRLEGKISNNLLEAWTKRENNNNTSEKVTTGLQKLELSKNKFSGAFPMGALFKYASDLKSLDLSDNLFTGDLPNEIVFGRLNNVELIAAISCQQPLTREEQHQDETGHEESSIQQHQQSKDCILDAPGELQHTFVPGKGAGSEIEKANANEPPEYAGLGKLEDLDLSRNSFTGHLPKEWMKLPALKILLLSHNQLSGSLPTEVWKAVSLEQLEMSHNQLTGKIPSLEQSKTGENSKGDNENNTERGWSNLSVLKSLHLDHNQISGTISYGFFEGLSLSLEELDLGSNRLAGSLPSSIAKMTRLKYLDVHGNQLTGRLPHKMNQMYPDVRLNLTDNLITGTVPKIFCGGGAASSNLLFRQFGCDAILCPTGTFHPNGAASLYSGCRPCPIKKGDNHLSAKTLGRRRCGEDNERTAFVHGDLNGDGVLSEREVLRLLYTYTIGKNWGQQFETWADTAVDKCDLNGVVCVDDKVAKLDLTDASMCANDDRKAAPAHECKGIPAEISKLTQLEILTMNRRHFLRGTLPTEIGELTKLKYLDISSCPMVTGELPSEIGRLTDLKYLNIGGCRFSGTIPEELFELSKMEKLHLSMNKFTGTVPSSVEKMTNLKEMLLSRTYVNGTIPEGIGELVALENFEMYGNQLFGAIPESLGRCSNLKRIDLFNNKLTGTIPESLTDIRALQILHIKLNHLSGTISSGFGKLPNLSWFDVSTNHLHGTIAESFGHSKTLKDFRLGGGNMIHNPVPKSLCSNININGGLTKAYGCSGVICPLGTYSDPGHATHSDGCKTCPHGRTTTYLGSSRCIELTDEDILTMFYDVMAASNTFPMQEKHWAFGREGPICTWNGVECDDTETIETIWFPLLELNVDMHG